VEVSTLRNVALAVVCQRAQRALFQWQANFLNTLLISRCLVLLLSADCRHTVYRLCHQHKQCFMRVVVIRIWVFETYVDQLENNSVPVWPSMPYLNVSSLVQNINKCVSLCLRVYVLCVVISLCTCLLLFWFVFFTSSPLYRSEQFTNQVIISTFRHSTSNPQHCQHTILTSISCFCFDCVIVFV
jgi:hypothetical protein